MQLQSPHPALLQPLSGAPQLTEFRNLLDSVVRDAVTGLRQLSNDLLSQEDAERKRAILAYLHRTRQRLLRLHVLAQWGEKSRAFGAVSGALNAAARQANAARDAADQLAHTHEQIKFLQAPAHDVATAVEVHETGGYRLLPLAIEELRPKLPPSAADRAEALRLIDQLLRVRLLQEDLPDGLQVSSVGDGVASVRLQRLFEAKLTLVPSPDDDAVLQRCGAVQAAAAAPPAHQEVSAEKPEAATTAATAAIVQTAAAGTLVPKQPKSLSEQPAAEPAGKAAAGEADAPPEAMSEAEAPDSRQTVADAAQYAWRWRLLACTILPDFSTREAAVPAQSATALQASLEQRMWAAADAAVLRSHGTDIGAQVDSSAPGAASTPAQSATGTAGARVSPAGTPAGSDVAAGSQDAAAAQTPLQLMVAVLKDIASRLLVHEAVGDLRRLAAHGSAWHPYLKISGPRLLPAGIRFAFWTGTHPVSAAAAAVAAQEKAVPGEKPPTLQPGHTVEVGIDGAGDLRVVAEPPLPQLDSLRPSSTATTAAESNSTSGARHAVKEQKAAAAAATAAAAAVAVAVRASNEGPHEQLTLDPASGDGEALLQHVTLVAAICQLVALFQTLQRMGRVSALGGHLKLSFDNTRLPDHQQHQAEMQRQEATIWQHREGTMVGGPQLALQSGGITMLVVAFACHTGRLTVCVNPEVVGDAHVDPLALAKQEELVLARQQQEAVGRAAAPGAPPGLLPAAAGIAAAAARISHLFAVLEQRRRSAAVTVEGRRLGLRPSSLPAGLLQRYQGHAAGGKPPPRPTVMAFPPSPPLAGFPPWPLTSATSAAAVLQGDYSLRFHLLAAHHALVEASEDGEAREQGGASLRTTSMEDGSQPGSGKAMLHTSRHEFWLAAAVCSADGVCKEVVHLQRCPPYPLPARQAPTVAQHPLQRGPLLADPCDVGAVTESRPPQTAKRKRPSNDDDNGNDSSGANHARDGSDGNDHHSKFAKGNSGMRQWQGPANGMTHHGLQSPILQPGSAQTTANSGKDESSRQPAAEPSAATSDAATSAPAEQPRDTAGNADKAVRAAVEWSRRQMNWWTLLFHLKALQIPFSEQLTAGPPGGLPLAISSTAASVKHSTPVRSLRVDGIPALERLLPTYRQHPGNNSVHPEGDAPSDMSAGSLVLLPLSPNAGSFWEGARWRAVLCSHHPLASVSQDLQESSARLWSDGVRHGTTGSHKEAIWLNRGLAADFSEADGETVLTTVQLVAQAARAQTCLHRLQTLAQATQSQRQPSEQSGRQTDNLASSNMMDGMPYESTNAAVGGNGISVISGKPQPGVKREGAGSHGNTRNDHGLAMHELGPGTYCRQNSSFSLPGCAAVEIAAASLTSVTLTLQLAPSALPSSAAAEAQQTLPAPEFGQQTAECSRQGAQLQLSLSWDHRRTDARKHADAERAVAALQPAMLLPSTPGSSNGVSRGDLISSVRCSITAQLQSATHAKEDAMACLPASWPCLTDSAAGGLSPNGVLGRWCAVLEQSADAGEEALLLQAVAIAADPLMTVDQALHPDQLHSTGWSHPEVSVCQTGSSLFATSFVVSKRPGTAISVALRCFADGLLWLSAHANAMASTTGGSDPGIHSGKSGRNYTTGLSADTSVPAQAGNNAAHTQGVAPDLDIRTFFEGVAKDLASQVSLPAERCAKAGVWLHISCLAEVMRLLLQHLSSQG